MNVVLRYIVNYQLRVLWGGERNLLRDEGDVFIVIDVDRERSDGDGEGEVSCEEMAKSINKKVVRVWEWPANRVACI